MSYAKIIRVVFLLLLFIVRIKANPDISKSDEGGEQLSQISLIAVGFKPPRRYEKAVNGKAPRMLLPRSEEVPPSRLYFKGEESTNEKLVWQSLRVSFNRGANLKAIAPEKTLQLYKKIIGSGEYVKYVSLPPSIAGSKSIYFLIPSSQGSDLWEESPVVEVFDLEGESIDGKKFVFKNLSRIKVSYDFNGMVRELPPMDSVSYARPEIGKFCRLAARCEVDGKIIFNTAVRLDKTKNKHLFVFYDANPKTNSGRSVGVFKMVLR